MCNVLAKYWLDASGHRAVKDVDGSKTLFFNLGTMQLEAYDVPTDMASSTILEPGIDRPLAEVSSSGTLTFYHQDWLGNAAMITNAAGAKVQTYTYDVWGKPSGFDSAGVSITPGSFVSRILFTAREYDVETGLYHYRARAYSPTLGRFIQSDPIDFAAGDVNVFRYVANNPVNWRDPLGLAPGDSYPSADSAAKDAMRDIYDDSINKDLEYGGEIYKKPNGCYSYTEGREGKQHSAGVRPGIPNYEGYYHSHGAESGPSYDDEKFSPEDKKIADDSGKPAYVVTPKGDMKKYDPNEKGAFKNPVKKIGNVHK